ncbi:MAG: phosphoserine phosphatase SerB [Leptospira sp.]|nr:phosphoserine phosphatase SerB [Leptospira sp.]
METRRGDLAGMYWHLPKDYLDLSIDEIRSRLIPLRNHLSGWKLDVLYLTHLLDEQPSLFVFDMDSTIIKEEVIDELARKNGLYEEVARVTKEAMEGGLGFEEALRKRVVHLQGLPESSFSDLYKELHPNEGVPVLLKDLRNEFSAKRAILSGGFTPILEMFSKDHELDYFEANVLELRDGKLTGGLDGRIVGKERKQEALTELREKWKIDPTQVVAVGDGANDYLMLSEAGIGIGFHAKDGLKDQILNWVDHTPMDALLLLFTPSL